MKTRTIGILIGALALLSLVALVAERADKSRRESRLGSGPLLLNLDPAQVTRIEVVSKVVTWDINKIDGKWLLLPTRLPADPAAVSEILDRLKAIDQRELAATTSTAHKSFGLADGDASVIAVRLWRGESRGDATWHVLVGKSATDYTSSYVRLAGDDRVYQTASTLTDALDRGERGFRDPAILAFDVAAARRLELTHAGVTTVAERGEEPQWRLTAPIAKPANGDVIDDILRQLSQLEADSFPSDSSPDRTGLDSPLASSKVTLADGTSFEVAWGKEEGGKVYAKKPGDDTVYSLFSFKRDAILKGSAELEKMVEPEASPADTSGE